jgi:hypothetical protein
MKTALALAMTLFATSAFAGEGYFAKQADSLIEFRPGLQVSLYKDWDVEHDSKSLPLSECKKKFDGIAACDSMSNRDQIIVSDEGKCVQANETADSKFCQGDVFRLDGRDYKVTQVMDRVMGFPVVPEPHDLTFTMATPLVRLSSSDGQKWIVESESLIPLAVYKNTKRIHAVTSEACGSMASTMTGFGKGCAVDSATENLRGMCSVMKGRLIDSSIKTDFARCEVDFAGDPDHICNAVVSGRCEY